MKRRKILSQIKKAGLKRKFIAEQIKIKEPDLSTALTGIRKTKRADEILDLVQQFLNNR